MLEQHVLRLHVAVYDPILVEGVEALQQAVRELPHQLQREPLELVLLYQLVKVDREQLECDACMVSERERIEHMDHVHRVVLVLLAEVLQDADLLLRLAVETFLVPHHLERYVLTLFVVVRFDDLPEATFANNFEHLVSISYVVVRYVDVRALLVVIFAIVREAYEPGPFLGVRAYKVHLGVVVYLAVFIGCKFVHVELHDLLGAGGGGWRALVRGLRGLLWGRRRPGLQRRQCPVPEQRAPERVRAPERHIAGHGRAAAATSAHLARRGRTDPRSLAHTTAPHCTRT